jgi:putative ABC transport system substrate-binding protein
MKTRGGQQTIGDRPKTGPIFALFVMLLVLSASVEAQQPGSIPRIGYVSTNYRSFPGPLVEAFAQGLRDIGYIEGKNILIEYRYAGGRDDRVPSLVNELIRSEVAVLVVPTLNAARAAKEATQTIPIVMITQGDPVASGFVSSLARPGGNITGLTRLQRELGGKRLELLKESFPRIARVGVLRDGGSQIAATAFTEYEAAAAPLKLQLQSLEVHEPSPDLAGAFRAAVNGRVHALVTVTSTLVFGHQKQVADLARQARLPSMFEGSTWVEAGGLISYSTDDREIFRRAALYVGKILKGAKPADLPIEQPTKFELVINLKTAKQMGLTIAPNVLARADRVIK